MQSGINFKLISFFRKVHVNNGILQSKRNNLRQNFEERQKMYLAYPLYGADGIGATPSNSVKETVVACSTVE